MKFWFSILVLLFPAYMMAQIRPDFFPEEMAPDNTNFEVYSQKGGTVKRAGMDALRTYFGAEIIDQVAPPALFGNPTAMRNKIVKVSNGQTWFVDWNGDAVIMSDNENLNFYQRYDMPTSDTLTFNPNYPYTNERLIIFENGKKLTPGDEYEALQGKVILKWRIPFVDYEIYVN